MPRLILLLVIALTVGFYQPVAAQVPCTDWSPIIKAAIAEGVAFWNPSTRILSITSGSEGLGNALVRDLVSAAESHGFTRGTTLGTGEANNPFVHFMYAPAGFNPCPPPPGGLRGSDAQSTDKSENFREALVTTLNLVRKISPGGNLAFGLAIIALLSVLAVGAAFAWATSR